MKIGDERPSDVVCDIAQRDVFTGLEADGKWPQVKML